MSFYLKTSLVPNSFYITCSIESNLGSNYAFSKNNTSFKIKADL